MIAKIILWIVALIIVPNLYIYWRFFIRRRKFRPSTLTYWIVPLIMVGYAVWLASARDFVPANIEVLYLFLFLLAMLVVPGVLFMVCSMVGACVKKITKSKSNWGNLVGLLLTIVVWVITIYGFTTGFNTITVRHIEYHSADLPERFDGYRMVQFSDAHLGTYGTWRQYVVEAFVDSILAQRADVILFTGDLQDVMPTEIYPHVAQLSRLKARDGVVAIMGNHDYPMYVNVGEEEKKKYLEETEQIMRDLGWNLLLNSHTNIYRGDDTIVIAGMENDGDGIHFPQLGDVAKTLEGVSADSTGLLSEEAKPFVVMLQHDPTGWRRKILSQSTAQLTLSGHTHGGQFKMLGWSPASLAYSEWGGMYYEGERALNVSTGVGGVVPFRFGLPGEICVITLKKK